MNCTDAALRASSAADDLRSPVSRSDRPPKASAPVSTPVPAAVPSLEHVPAAASSLSTYTG